MTKITLTLASGEKVTGTTNYTDTVGVELRMPDGSFRWIVRSEIR